MKQWMQSMSLICTSDGQFLSLLFPDIDWYLSPLEVRILKIDSPVSDIRMASLCGISRAADEVR